MRRLFPPSEDAYSPIFRLLRTNHVEVGTNDKPADPAARAAIHAKFKVPLLPRSDDMSRLQVYPRLSSLDVYSLQHEQRRSIDGLQRGSAQVSTFDKCTLIMPVLSRTGTISQRLDYYHKFDRLGQILVLWNKLDLVPPQLTYDNYSIPVEVVKMKRDSLNNRFYPWPQIKYDCIVNMVRRPFPLLFECYRTSADARFGLASRTTVSLRPQTPCIQHALTPDGPQIGRCRSNTCGTGSMSGAGISGTTSLVSRIKGATTYVLSCSSVRMHVSPLTETIGRSCVRLMVRAGRCIRRRSSRRNDSPAKKPSIHLC